VCGRRVRQSHRYQNLMREMKKETSQNAAFLYLSARTARLSFVMSASPKLCKVNSIAENVEGVFVTKMIAQMV